VSIYPGAQFLFSAALPPSFLRQRCGVASPVAPMPANPVPSCYHRPPCAGAHQQDTRRTRLLNFFQLRTASGWWICRLWLCRGPAAGTRCLGAADRRAGAARMLTGLMVVVDSRRGLLPADLQLLDWRGRSGRYTYCCRNATSSSAMRRACCWRARWPRSPAAGSRSCARRSCSRRATDRIDQARGIIDAWLKGGVRKGVIAQ